MANFLKNPWFFQSGKKAVLSVALLEAWKHCSGTHWTPLFLDRNCPENENQRHIFSNFTQSQGETKNHKNPIVIDSRQKGLHDLRKADKFYH